MYKYAVMLIASVRSAIFCLSVITRKMNGVGIGKSDPAACCGSTTFEVEGITSVFSRVILSFWISVSDDSIVVTTDWVPVLIFVKIDLQFRSLFHVVILDVHFQLEFALMRNF